MFFVFCLPDTHVNPGTCVSWLQFQSFPKKKKKRKKKRKKIKKNQKSPHKISPFPPPSFPPSLQTYKPSRPFYFRHKRESLLVWLPICSRDCSFVGPTIYREKEREEREREKRERERGIKYLGGWYHKWEFLISSPLPPLFFFLFSPLPPPSPPPTTKPPKHD